MFFDRPEAGERALLVHCSMDRLATASDDDVVEEFVELVRSAGVSPVYIETMQRHAPAPRFFIGAGKVEELAAIIRANDIEVVLFNHQLSPSQERNLEQEFQCKVLDRTGLILDIFAQRARSHAGKLQVELAQLDHISTRLVRGWTHLERQKGGIGLRGPGETQLETDRRLLRERIKWIKQRLNKVNAQRQQGRRSRSRAELPTVALVGYTNAGKSTLFNAFTESTVYVKDQLFATLDTTLRAVTLPASGKIIMADTVGFVRNLPHKLVEAFKATLEEAAQADLLLHVIDASVAEVGEHIHAVEAVLKEIGAGDIPTLHVMNKIDLLQGVEAGIDYRDAERSEPAKVWLSAADGSGLLLLSEAISLALGGGIWSGVIRLSGQEARMRAKLYALGAVVSEQTTVEGDSELHIRYSETELRRLLAAELPGLLKSLQIN